MTTIDAKLSDLRKELWLRRRNASILVWTTKEGKKVPINEMTDAHLVNTIKMLVRQQAEEEQRRQEEQEYLLQLDDALGSCPVDLF